MWMNILANVLGIELNIINTEGPALGAAILCAKAAGFNINSENDVLYSVKPDSKIAEIYSRKYEKFKTLYPSLKGFYKEK